MGVHPGALLLPGEVVGLAGADGAVADALGVVARKDELDRGEKGLDKLVLLVLDVLPDGVGDGDRGPLELEDGEGDAVDVDDDVGPLFVVALDGDLLGDREVVAVRVRPVDEADGRGLVCAVGLDLGAVAE